MGSHSNPVPKDMAANLQISFVSVMEEPSQQNNQGESANHTYLRNRTKRLKDALVATVTISEAHNLISSEAHILTQEQNGLAMKCLKHPKYLDTYWTRFLLAMLVKLQPQSSCWNTQMHIWGCPADNKSPWAIQWSSQMKILTSMETWFSLHPSWHACNAAHHQNLVFNIPIMTLVPTRRCTVWSPAGQIVGRTRTSR